MAADTRLVSLTAALLTVCLTAAAQILLKHGINAVQFSRASKLTIENEVYWISLLKNPAILLGVSVYGGSTLLWLFVLSRMPLSQAYPFVGISIVITTVVGALMLGERLSVHQIIGVLLVCAGVWLVTNVALHGPVQ